MASNPEPSEDQATTEERLAWLRARGVTVEVPGDREPGPAPIGGQSFAFVKIPFDEAASFEELSGPRSGGDALPTLLSSRFSGCSLTDDELSAHAATAGQAVEISVLRALMMKGSAESFRLAVPTEANGREGVYAYIDEASAIKGLPLNARAGVVARQCGFPPSCEFRGDVFIGRQKWSEAGLVENVDFKLRELDAGSLWSRRAETENLQFQKDTRGAEHDEAQLSADGKPAGGECDEYEWRDQGEELEVVLKVPEGTSKKDVKIEFKRQELRVLKPTPFTLKLHKPVQLDGCMWTMGKPGQVTITLEKESASPWLQLLE